jgi:hypothetical protein
MPVTRDDWIAVRNSAVYQDLQATLREAIGVYGAEVINRETSNTDRDMFVRGSIKALIEVLEWEPDMLVEAEEQEA